MGFKPVYDDGRHNEAFGLLVEKSEIMKHLSGDELSKMLPYYMLKNLSLEELKIKLKVKIDDSQTLRQRIGNFFKDLPGKAIGAVRELDKRRTRSVVYDAAYRWKDFRRVDQIMGEYSNCFTDYDRSLLKLERRKIKNDRTQ